MQNQTHNITFDKIPVNPDWCFKNVRSIEQWTHGYHRYPAKFLPNLVKKLIEEYTYENDLVADRIAITRSSIGLAYENNDICLSLS